MRIAAVSRVDMTVDPVRASADFHMHTNKLHAGLLVGLSLGAIAGLLSPVALIAIDAMSSSQVIHTLGEHIGSTILLAAGIALGVLMLTFPLRAGLARLAGATTVQMADGMVHVQRGGLFGAERWSEPLSRFCGVTHHIRATLSGARHEIILVHPEPGKDILLHLASRHPQEGVEHYANLLGLGEMQPKELYSRRRSAPAPAPSASTSRPQATELRAQAA